nr:MAG TPA: hypothetical protein [Caudoviricetes sp.]
MASITGIPGDDMDSIITFVSFPRSNVSLVSWLIQ